MAGEGEFDNGLETEGLNEVNLDTRSGTLDLIEGKQREERSSYSYAVRYGVGLWCA